MTPQPIHGAWLGSTALMDLEDPRIRIKALALTQLCASEQAKALAIYLFIKRMPFRKSLKLRHRSRHMTVQHLKLRRPRWRAKQQTGRYPNDFKCCSGQQLSGDGLRGKTKVGTA